jgi:hypothetical protein
MAPALPIGSAKFSENLLSLSCRPLSPTWRPPSEAPPCRQGWWCNGLVPVICMTGKCLKVDIFTSYRIIIAKLLDLKLMWMGGRLYEPLLINYYPRFR